jgi:cytochrome c-type biogenesis protein CcmH/NrfG
MSTRQVPKLMLNILLTPEERELLEQAYGSGHGLSSRLRSELLNIARVRLRRAGGNDKPKGGHFIKEVLERYGTGAADQPTE